MKKNLICNSLLLLVFIASSCGGGVNKKEVKDSEESKSTEVKIANMPTINPWLAESTYPISHDNPGATDAVAVAGPTEGKQLTEQDVKTVATLFTSNPTIKKENGETVVIAAGADGIRKIKATGEEFELVSYLPYPGLESIAKNATPEAIEALLQKANEAYRSKDDAKILAMSKEMEMAGASRKTIPNGCYNMIDKDGFHYALFNGMQILKTTDDNDINKPLRVVASKDFTSELPKDIQKMHPHFLGMGMTYDGNIAAAANGALFLIDRDLNFKGMISFPGELVENSICIDEKGIYVVTSRNMYKVVWTGTKLSYDETDGGWKSGYNTMTSQQATAAGALTISGGSGTTPTLMGFGDDRDKLVVISDADPTGIHVVAFWRDQIPADFKQKPGTKSNRIADQALVDITNVTIEPSPVVLGKGVVVINNAYPKPVADIWGNAMTSGVTRPAPFGVQKFTWNPETYSFEKNWTNKEIDNTDVMVPVVSAKSQMIYLANKTNGIYEYVGVDWNTGEIKARWQFPNDSRKWNAYGGITALMDDGDLMIGGFFAVKRVNIGINK